jgi:hypothetical protein
MEQQEFIIPYIISNSIAFVLIFVCYRWFKAGRILFGLIFLSAGVFNFYTAGTTPDAYVEMYGSTAVFPFYRDFIHGLFSQHTGMFVRLIAIGQLMVGFLLFTKKTYFKMGIIGAMIFLAAITPLGTGSAFPCTLLMIIGLYLLFRRGTDLHVFQKSK